MYFYLNLQSLFAASFGKGKHVSYEESDVDELGNIEAFLIYEEIQKDQIKQEVATPVDVVVTPAACHVRG